jgi:hypothetical protein
MINSTLEAHDGALQSGTTKRLPLPAVALWCVLLLSNHGKAQDLTAAEFDGHRRLDGIRSLGLDELPGRMPAYYSPSARARAKELQALLNGEAEYYAALFRMRFAPLTLRC